MCTHPLLPQEPEYLRGDVGWRRDGRGIDTVGLGRTNPNSTTTQLQFTITEDTIGNYTCFLVNLVRSRADESNSVSVRPLGKNTLNVMSLQIIVVPSTYLRTYCMY